MKITEKKILLLGSGYTLSKVAERLSAFDYVAVARSEKNLARLKSSGSAIETCDLTNPGQVNRLFNKFPEVQIVIDSTPPDQNNPSLIADNIFNNIISNSKIKKLIYLSSTGVYNAKDGRWINEKSQTTTQYQKGLNRLIVENTYNKLSIPTVCLRISAIYGPSRGTGYNIKNGKSMNLLSKERWTNRIHVDDLVNIIIKIMEADLSGSFPEILNCSDDFPCQVVDLIEHYAKVLNLEKTFVESLLIKSDLPALKASRESNQRIDNSLLKDILKYEFKFPSFKISHKSGKDIQ